MKIHSFLLVCSLVFVSFTISFAQDDLSMHTVEADETLSQIAKDHNSSVKEIKKVNKLKGDRILKGQELIIPGKGIHVVSAGESLFKISQQYGLSVTNLKKWNNLKSDYIQTNQALKISPSAVFTAKGGIPTEMSFSTTRLYTAMHTVGKKETLFSISSKYGISVNALKNANDIKGNTIIRGEDLVLPVQIHKVAASETLSKIAKRYEIALADLKKANDLKGNKILEGQILIIPG